jgi:Putative lumazine-binding
MERALHPELAKRCRGIEGDDPDALETLSAAEMIDATADGEGRREDAADRRIEVKIEYLSGDIASVTCLCHLFVDLLQLIRMPEGWRIVNAVWRLR